MANIDNPAGFYPLGNLAPCREYTASAAVAKGDLVAIASGKVLPWVSGTHATAIGVAQTSAAASADCFVWDDPDTEFVGQCSGTYATTLDGTSVDAEGTTGIFEVNENASAAQVLLIKRQYLGEPDNVTVGANSRVVFTICKHHNTQGAPAATIADVAAQTSPTATNGSGASASTFSGAECDLLRAEVALNLAAINAILARLELAGISALA